MKLFGNMINSNADHLFIKVQEINIFNVSAEKFAFFILLSFYLSALILILLFSKKKLKEILKITVSVIIIGIFRYLLLIFIYLEKGNVRIFWDFWWTVISFLPMLFIILFLFKDSAHIPGILKTSNKKGINIRINLLLYLLIFLSGFSFLGAKFFQDPGIQKQGRVVIDEYHSNWEWSETRMDTASYGVRTTYNYYNLRQYLNYYYDVKINNEIFKDSLLENVDVLILKTPTQEYLDEEIPVIKRFVKNGGSLWLHGDHTNIFGMNTYLNKISREFGFRYDYDALYDVDGRGKNIFNLNDLFIHPVVKGISPFLFLTSCSIKANLKAEEVLMGYGLGRDYVDYCVNTFFGDFKQSADEEFGLFLQIIALKYGKGRIIGFTDSTIFSNFSMFIPGKPELAINSVNWLNRKNSLSFLNTIFLFLGFLFLFVFLILFTRNFHLKHLVFATVFLILGIVLAINIFQYFNKQSFKNPIAKVDYRKIAFEKNHSNYLLPIIRDVPDDHPFSYHTFFVNSQKYDFVPSVIYDINELKDEDVLIFIKPQNEFSNEELTILDDYLKQGGKILLMDNLSNVNSCSNQFLKNYNLQILKTRVDSINIIDKERDRNLYTSRRIRAHIKGGEPLFLTKKNKTIFCRNKVGNGELFVFTDIVALNNKSLGENSIIPDKEQIKLYRMNYRILDHLISAQSP